MAGGALHPKMMSIGLHGCISGYPARAMALAHFLDYAQGHDKVVDLPAGGDCAALDDRASVWHERYPAR